MLCFPVPAVKALEFGQGFRLSVLAGSAANDALQIKQGKVRALTPIITVACKVVSAMGCP